MRKLMYELDEKLIRPDFNKVKNEIRNIAREAGQKGDTELENKLYELLNLVDNELKKNEEFKSLLFLIANKF